MPASQVSSITAEEQRLTLTLQKYASTELADLFWGHNPFLFKMNATKRVISDFGESIAVPIHTAESGMGSPTGVSNPQANFRRNLIKGASKLKFYPAEIFYPFSIPEREVMIQGSETRKLDTIRTTMKLVTDNWANYIMSQLWAHEATVGGLGDETTLASIRCLYNKAVETGGVSPLLNTDGPAMHNWQACSTGGYAGWAADLEGSAISTVLGVSVGTAVQVLGGVSRIAANSLPINCPVLNPSTTKRTLSQYELNMGMMAGSRNGERPDFVVTDDIAYATLLQILQKQMLLTNTSKLADYGYTSFSYMGADWVWDDQCPKGALAASDRIYFMNLRNLAWYCNVENPQIRQGGIDTEAPLLNYRMHWLAQLVPLVPGRGQGSVIASIR